MVKELGTIPKKMLPNWNITRTRQWHSKNREIRTVSGDLPPELKNLNMSEFRWQKNKYNDSNDHNIISMRVKIIILNDINDDNDSSDKIIKQ